VTAKMGQLQAAIGEILDISESRVSQMHTEIISRLRNRIALNRERFIMAL
jgi:DNA-directed RNA polymerase specialized sigma subunit